MRAITWKAVVRLPNGFPQAIRIVADSQTNARAILEAQFGQGSIQSGPWRLSTR